MSPHYTSTPCIAHSCHQISVFCTRYHTDIPQKGKKSQSCLAFYLVPQLSNSALNQRRKGRESHHRSRDLWVREPASPQPVTQGNENGTKRPKRVTAPSRTICAVPAQALPLHLTQIFPQALCTPVQKVSGCKTSALDRYSTDPFCLEFSSTFDGLLPFQACLQLHRGRTRGCSTTRHALAERREKPTVRSG